MAGTQDLNGLWSGQFYYPEILRMEPVSFTAWIDDTNGLLSGSILEPNTFADGGPSMLSASLQGERTGTGVIFTKRYEAGQNAHSENIVYSGTIAEDFKLITGKWAFERPDRMSGLFVLSRSSDEQSAKLSEKAQRQLVDG